MGRMVGALQQLCYVDAVNLCLTVIVTLPKQQQYYTVVHMDYAINAEEEDQDQLDYTREEVEVEADIVSTLRTKQYANY